MQHPITELNSQLTLDEDELLEDYMTLPSLVEWVIIEKDDSENKNKLNELIQALGEKLKYWRFHQEATDWNEAHQVVTQYLNQIKDCYDNRISYSYYFLAIRSILGSNCRALVNRMATEVTCFLEELQFRMLEDSYAQKAYVVLLHSCLARNRSELLKNKFIQDAINNQINTLQQSANEDPQQKSELIYFIRGILNSQDANLISTHSNSIIAYIIDTGRDDLVTLRKLACLDSSKLFRKIGKKYLAHCTSEQLENFKNQFKPTHQYYRRLQKLIDDHAPKEKSSHSKKRKQPERAPRQKNGGYCDMLPTPQEVNDVLYQTSENTVTIPNLKYAGTNKKWVSFRKTVTNNGKLNSGITGLYKTDESKGETIFKIVIHDPKTYQRWYEEKTGASQNNAHKKLKASERKPKQKCGTYLVYMPKPEEIDTTSPKVKLHRSYPKTAGNWQAFKDTINRNIKHQCTGIKKIKPKGKATDSHNYVIVINNAKQYKSWYNKKKKEYDTPRQEYNAYFSILPKPDQVTNASYTDNGYLELNKLFYSGTKKQWGNFQKYISSIRENSGIIMALKTEETLEETFFTLLINSCEKYQAWYNLTLQKYSRGNITSALSSNPNIFLPRPKNDVPSSRDDETQDNTNPMSINFILNSG